MQEEEKLVNEKRGSHKILIISAVAAVIILMIAVGIFVIPRGEKFDLQGVIRECGYSQNNGNGSTYVNYDNDQDAIVFNARQLWISLSNETSKEDSDSSNYSRRLCPIIKLGLLDNQQFVNEFVNRLNEDQKTEFSSVYSGKDGRKFTVTYKPAEESTYQFGRNSLSSEAKIIIKEKRGLF